MTSSPPSSVDWTSNSHVVVSSQPSLKAASVFSGARWLLPRCALISAPGLRWVMVGFFKIGPYLMASQRLEAVRKGCSGLYFIPDQLTPMAFILSLDAGTTSVRAILFDRAGRIRSLAQKEIRQIYPKPGWVEQDPQENWFSQMAVAVEALERARIRPRDIAGVGITNQRETTIVWNRKSGKAIHHAIVWQDRRTAGICDQLRSAGHDGMIQRRTGQHQDTIFTAPKAPWINA